jgi:hypothetical protein
MMMKTTILMVCATLFLGLVGCKASVEGEKARYTKLKDRFDAHKTTYPALRANIEQKWPEFEKQYAEASAKTGEEAIAAIDAVNDRIEAWETQIIPKPVATTSSATTSMPAGSKIGTAPATMPATAPASKVDTGSGFGTTTSAPMTAPATTPAPTPSGSGFGTTSAPATTPAGSGFGGQ